MASDERNEAEAPKGQERPTGSTSQCCGGDFGPFGSEGGAGCSPATFMAGMGRPTSEDREDATRCPMARMCGGMMKGGARGFGWMLLIPAALLLVLGTAILLVPKILTWLVAGGLIVAGGLMILGAALVRRPRTTAA